jgi:protein TIF31
MLMSVPPVIVRIPAPSHSRTLPKRSPAEDYSTLTLLPQANETVQELKLAINDWVGSYWLGPYSLRLPKRGEANGDGRGKALGKGRDGAEVREGERLSEWLEVGDVFAHLSEGQERVLEVSRGRCFILEAAYSRQNHTLISRLDRPFYA